MSECWEGTGGQYRERAIMMRQTERTLKNKRSGVIGVAGLRSRTLKIEEEASQKNKADELGNRPRRVWSETNAARRIGVTLVFI